jgi:hypothetical protein
MATEWNINTDIYNILDSVKNVQKRYIDDEDETTLSLGVFGFIADTEAKKIQTATILAGQLGNEMFPTRANLSKNILAHATFSGITNINAVPSRMDITLCIKTEDINKYMDSDNYFYLSAMSGIFIGDYEFHLDYDVKIRKIKVKDDSYSYYAQYITTNENGNPITNRLTTIINPYLKQPFVINIDNIEYVGIQCTIRQYTIEETMDTMISDSIIENKSYTFEYSNQMADFKVVVTTNGEEVEVTPYMYGSVIDPEETYYCWYQYISSNTVRITFDSKSYIPGLNSEIYIKAYTTLGAGGNFEYLDIDGHSEGLFLDLTATNYGYSRITTYLIGLSDSTNGSDRKSKEELKRMLPKASMYRGSITTEVDLNNYFDLINSESDSRVIMRKKVDNQLNRIWYGYFLLKDYNDNIIPTNTIKIRIDTEDANFVYQSDDGRYILPAGTDLRYDPSLDIAEPISSTLVPAEYSNEYFNSGYYYYKTIYNIVLCTEPLYAAYYLTVTNSESYFIYDYVNNDCDIQFIANRYQFEKPLITDQGEYHLGFNIIQSIINGNSELITTETITVVDDDGIEREETLTTENLKVVLVLYKEGKAYRWKECSYQSALSTPESGIYYFDTLIDTDETMDIYNNIKIMGCNEVGTTNTVYGYIEEDCQASIYILANIDVPSTTEYPRKDLDNIAPGYEDFTVTNIYKTYIGLDFFKDYTGVTNTKVEYIDGTESYYISGIPVVGCQYMSTNHNVDSFISKLKETKAYVDHCLTLVENSMSIDFKFFNTYGPSKTYRLEDETTSIGSIDINTTWKLSLIDTSDITTKNDIIKYIKNTIEDLNNLSDLHIPNLISDIINEYSTRINFIEFVGFNKFDTDDQHIIKVEPEDPLIPPEFINVRNTLDTETLELVPSIEIILV